MNLVPESIESNATEAYDETFKARLLGLDLRQLALDITTETNPVKLQLTLDVFGIDGNLFGFLALSPQQRLTLFARIIAILRTSGTKYSIRSMGIILGAADIQFSYGLQIYHDGNVSRNGLFYHNGGGGWGGTQYSIVVYVYGVALADRQQYEADFRRLFERWQPIRIFIISIIFV
jgi:hypothetical protein